eukprot:TRINITY_DN21093_c0_g2_i1.p2 TRINITY_DN21093_c0_g2~~TRINITY_DN21093_c0_g2_i1.p2  ORF type:complete len:178 (-),score=25.50 TRINITY_DN21093_c0_g2_i1:708-1241(-)
MLVRPLRCVVGNTRIQPIIVDRQLKINQEIRTVPSRFAKKFRGSARIQCQQDNQGEKSDRKDDIDDVNLQALEDLKEKWQEEQKKEFADTLKKMGYNTEEAETEAKELMDLAENSRKDFFGSTRKFWSKVSKQQAEEMGLTPEQFNSFVFDQLFFSRVLYCTHTARYEFDVVVLFQC